MHELANTSGKEAIIWTTQTLERTDRVATQAANAAWRSPVFGLSGGYWIMKNLITGFQHDTNIFAPAQSCCRNLAQTAASPLRSPGVDIFDLTA